MSTKTQNPDGSILITTERWLIQFANQLINVSDKDGRLKHTAICGDPHICTDGFPVQDFPSPTCSFVLTDGTLLIVDAPAADQPLHDVHVFTTDGKHYAFGTNAAFDDVIGTVFQQQDAGQFFGVVSRPLGPPPPNVVLKQFADC